MFYNKKKNWKTKNPVSRHAEGKYREKLKYLFAQTSKESACNGEAQVRSLGWEDPLEKGTATHSSILAWEIPWTEESGELQFMELQKSQTQLNY